MTDPRLKRLAGIFTDYSVRIKKGDVVQLSYGPEARELALEIYKRILKKGAFPRVRCSEQGFSYAYYRIAKDEQLKSLPKIALFEAKNTDAWISIGSEYNTREFSNINPKKLSMRSKAVKRIQDTVMKKNNWVIFEYPTNSLAQDAEMSLEEFEDFVFKAALKDWKKEVKKQQKLMNLLNKTDRVRIEHEDTQLSFSIKGKKAVKCAGTHNMPDGEVFTEPVKNSVEGFIKYSFPAIRSGAEVRGIRLEFRKGKVVKATAEKNERLLKTMIRTDAGAKYAGEFGIGLNYNIKKHVKQILFDEKIGGTIHLALGMAFPETGGENKSAIHWDMIKDMRKGGKIYFDGKLVMKNGKWNVYS